MRIHLTLLAAIAVTSIAVPPAEAQARRTIVGSWGVTAAECGTTGAFKIAPQAIVTDEMSCVLPKVSRVGDVVTFGGRCDDGGQGAKPETIVATLRGNSLDLAFEKGGGRYRNLVRCAR